MDLLGLFYVYDYNIATFDGNKFKPAVDGDFRVESLCV